MKPEELSDFRIKCIIELFSIKEGDMFYYDADTDEYFNQDQKFPGRFIRDFPDNFENMSFNENTNLNTGL